MLPQLRSRSQRSEPVDLIDGISMLRLEVNILRKNSGIALMVVLWVMTLLIVITFSFAVMVRTEVFSTTTFKEQMENKYLAEAGMHRGMLEIYYRNAYKNNQLKLDNPEVYSTDGTFYHGQMEDGQYRVAVMDESGKIDINQLNDTTGIVLNNLLVNMGIEKNHADTIVDSILDWKDADDLHRLNGAESDYYMSLPNPYKAKDANFDNLDELLLVKGVTRDILYGGAEKPGLIQYLTVYSSASLININTAQPEVLKAIPFLTDDMLQSIISYRKADNTKKDGSGLQAMLPAGDYAKISPYVTTADSNTYSIEAIGYKTVMTGGYSLKAVVMVAGADSYKILYYQSPAHIETPKNDRLSK